MMMKAPAKIFWMTAPLMCIALGATAQTRMDMLPHGEYVVPEDQQYRGGAYSPPTPPRGLNITRQQFETRRQAYIDSNKNTTPLDPNVTMNADLSISTSYVQRLNQVYQESASARGAGFIDRNNYKSGVPYDQNSYDFAGNTTSEDAIKARMRAISPPQSGPMPPVVTTPPVNPPTTPPASSGS